MNRYFIIIASILCVVGDSAEARISRDDQLVVKKLLKEITAIRRDLATVRSKVEQVKPTQPVQPAKPSHPAVLFLASAVTFPPEGMERLLAKPPVAAVPPAHDADVPSTLKGYKVHVGRLPGVGLAGVPAPLVGWLNKVAGECKGYKNISACRPGARVAGSGRTSLHASCRAVDFQVASPSCAWAVLNPKTGPRFPGGLSNDYARVAHYHVSWAKGSGEWGARFAHGGGRSYGKTRYAKRWKARHAYRAQYRRYASRR